MEFGEKQKLSHPQYTIRKSFWGAFGSLLIQAANHVLFFFSLRKKRKFLGIVYDSLSKQPLDPVIIKLAYADGVSVETNISDMSGKYGFLARPGKFKILAKKSNYSFPSRFISGDSDGIYDHLYHGEFFELTGDYDVIAPNIPMDPLGKDWNQSAKQLRTPSYPYFKYFYKKIIAVFFWFGFASVLAAAYFHFGLWAYFCLSAYALIILLSFTCPKASLVGKISQNLFPQKDFFLELSRPNMPGIILGRSSTIPDGRFFLRANPGVYSLTVKYKDDQNFFYTLGSVKVRVGPDGVVNHTIIVKPN